jgi:acetyltransferase
MSLEQIFSPKSIALVGASEQDHSVGKDILVNLNKGYKGQVFAVNPYHQEVLGQICYPSLTSLPQVPDLVVVALHANLVLPVFHEMANLNVKSAIVVSSGFKEFSQEGKLLEAQIAEICEKNQISLVGVNCLGVMNTENKMNASFASHLPKKGKISLVAQSGALCTAIIDYSKTVGMGFAKIASIGNKTVLDATDMLQFLEKDEQTGVIMLYLEDVKDAHKLLEISKNITKPVIVLKAGRSRAGKMAAKSHTGAISGSNNFYDALFRQAGFIHVDTIEQMFDVALILNDNSLPQGPNVVIVTNAGGPATLTSDSLDIHGLKLANLSPATQTKLKKLLPSGASFHNPVDLLGDSDASRYQLALNAVLEDENVDSCLVILTPQANTEIELTAKTILEIQQNTTKPLIVSFIGGSDISSAVQMLDNEGVTTIPYPDNAAESLALIYQAVKNKQALVLDSNLEIEVSSEKKAHIHKLFETAKNQELENLSESFSKEILESFGFPVLAGEVVKSEKEAQKAVEKIGTKCVFKVVSPDILHKSDVGGVILDVDTYNAKHSYSKLLENIQRKAPDARVDGVLVVEMADLKQGFEFFLGVKTEASLGKLIVFGLGGIFVELISDVTFSVVPLSEVEATKMIERIRSSKAFAGIRGRPELDKAKLIETIVRLSKFVSEFEQVQEIDLNPVLVLPNGCKILDSRIVVA